MFGILGWIVFGLIIGALAKLVMPAVIRAVTLRRFSWESQAVIGGWLGRTLGLYAPGEPAGFIMALIGSVVLLVIYRFIVTSRATV